jgi:hypothetical protein
VVTIQVAPIVPFPSHGDLWLNTWADDGNLYTGWGDGYGVVLPGRWTDCGIARWTGRLPAIVAEERTIDAPTADPPVNDKPSSLLAIGERLYGMFHSPLGDPWIGYVAYSDDAGQSWTRVGFYQEGEIPPENASPWTRDRGSPFRCMFLLNMGQGYRLNQDGYVYGLGIGREWGWSGGLQLARVRVEEILNYGSYEYYAGGDGGHARWSSSQADAAPVVGIHTTDQGSAMYHPGIQRYLFLTGRELFHAPAPWGPWRSLGAWVEGLPEIWQGGYQPGIISKDTGPESFWFTIAGQNDPPRITYRLQLGLMVLRRR